MSNTLRMFDTAPPTTSHPFFRNGRWIWEKNYPEGIAWDAPLLGKPLFHLLDQAAEEFPFRPVFDFMGRRTTYAEAAATVNKIARGLQDQGVKRGVKVGLFLPNTPYAVLFHYGILKAGGTVVNYNPLYAPRELKNQIEDSGTDIMVTLDNRQLYEKVHALCADTRLRKIIVCPLGALLPFPKNLLHRVFGRDTAGNLPRDERHVFYEDLVANDGAARHVFIDPEKDVAVLQYTGGTTGVPKGAALTHANVYANTEQLTHWTSRVVVPGQETVICVLPFFHVFAMTAVMHCAIRAGMNIVIHPRFDLDAALESIRRHRPGLFPAVPAVFNAMAASPDVGKTDFSCLKFCITGGAPMPRDVQRLFEEKTGCNALREAYGLTETSPGVTFNPPTGRVKPGSVGLPLPGTIVEIVDSETGLLLPPGEKGEVCVRGPQVMQGYYNKPEETANVLKNGRLHTGDVGYVDDDGYLFLVDRIKDLILVRGYNVYPRMVEEAIYLHPAVEECIVAGVPDAERGETVQAWVKLFSGRTATEAEILAFLEDKISPIERPRKIIIRDTPLPKTAVGKLSKKDLLEQEGLRPSAAQ